MQKKLLINRIIKKKNIVFFILFKLLKPFIRNSDLLASGYSLIRYLDDKIDSPTFTPYESSMLINHYLYLTEELSNGNFITASDDYETILSDLICFDMKNNYQLKSALKRLLLSLKFDIERTGRILTSSELEYYSYEMGSSFISFMSPFLKIPNSHSSSISFLASLSCQSYMLKDLKDDFDKGYFNISKEDIEKYQINLKELESVEIRKWIFDKSKILLLQMKAIDLTDLGAVPFLSRLILILFLAPRIYFLNRISTQNISLKIKYRFRLTDYFLMSKTVTKLLMHSYLRLTIS